MQVDNVFVSTPKQDLVDVAVVGGGPAGSSLAALLAQTGLSVTVLDASSGGVWKVGQSLPPSARPVLHGMGVWQTFARDVHLPHGGTRTYWGSHDAEEQKFTPEHEGRGWHLDRNHFDRMLAIRVRESGALYWPQTRVLAFERDKKKLWQLSLTSQEKHWQIKARFIVDATGRKSFIAQELGVRRQVDDKLLALAMIMRPDPRRKDEDHFTMIESAAEGWWYTTLVPGGHRAVFFMTDGDLPQAGRARGTKAWASYLNRTEHISYHLKHLRFRIAGKPHLMVANSSRLTNVTGPGWLALGDAATAFDPLCSQGLLAAMVAAFHAKDAIANLFRGNQEALKAYAGMMDLAYQDYLTQRDILYNRETRWGDEPFWKRRLSPDKKNRPVESPAARPYSLE